MVQNRESRGEERSEPAIRTMRSDISEFLHTTKPSLISILAAQAEAGSRAAVAPGRTGRHWFLLVAAVAIAGVLAVTIWLLHTPAPAPAPSAPGTPPPSLLAFDTTREVTIPSRRDALRVALADRTPQADGSLRRLTIRIRTPEGATAIPDLAALAGGSPPPALMAEVTGPPQVFTYRSVIGVDIGFVISVRSAERTLQALIDAEPELSADFSFLFAGEIPPAVFSHYEDRTYRNVSFRYLNFTPDRDRGLGYLLFPSPHRIVMATSEAALRAAIDRLFQN